MYRKFIHSIGSMNTSDHDHGHNKSNNHNNKICGDKICGANILGTHLGGTYFAYKKRGTYSSDCILHQISDNTTDNNDNNSNDNNTSNKNENDLIEDTYGVANLSTSGVSIVTLTPKLDSTLSAIDTIYQHGVIVAM